jgi:hypothetical protein
MTEPCDATLDPVDPAHTMDPPGDFTLDDNLEERTLSATLPEYTLEEIC